MEAQATDEDVAAVLLDREPDEDAPSVRWSEWSPERDALARIEDRLQEIARAVVMSAGGKPGRFRPSARPPSAMQRLRADRHRERHRQLVARMVRDN